MYINKIEITDVKSIGHISMKFDNPAGWHVLIGDNGSGKSTLVKAISLALIGPEHARALRLPLGEWVKTGAQEGSVSLTVTRDEDWDSYAGQSRPLIRPFPVGIRLRKSDGKIHQTGILEPISTGTSKIDPFNYIWSNSNGWFSTGFGPFRRFSGGNQEWLKVFYSNPAAAAHLSVFGEDVALTESLEWLTQLKFRSLEKEEDATYTLESIKTLVNDFDLLPHGEKIHEVGSKGVEFVDGNGLLVDVTELSDGFRSNLSMLFELIRQLVLTYGANNVFRTIGEGNIPVPGVVLIDEIDAHLHPTWQTRVGDWFTRIFPNIQFIVTTHSPLVCRAAENGSIWRLAAPGSQEDSGKVTGADLDRLLYGNILDAYGTEVFGQSPVRNVQLDNRKKRLGELKRLAALGKATVKEEEERRHLQQTLSTE